MTGATAPVADRRPFALVTTTIHVPTALAGYVEQFERCGHRDVTIVVVGDRKTPPDAERWLAQLARSPYRVVYLGPDDQSAWLRRFPALDRLLPWNSIQRRNLGYLIAAELGARVIVSVDDDNYVGDDDFLASHAIVGTTADVEVVASPTGWLNVCDVLRTEPPTRIVPRGFPQSRRHDRPALARERRPARVVVNAGLWLGEPDVDAVTRLVTPVEVVGVHEGHALPLALAAGTTCPFNSQNTAFDVRMLPCMYLVVMGAAYRGLAIGRYDDIWMSYAAKRVIDHLGDSVTFGRPLVLQRRNPHDILDDLAAELPGMVLTETLARALAEVELHETSYGSAYMELIEETRAALARPAACDATQRAFLGEVLDGMAVWGAVCRELGP